MSALPDGLRGELDSAGLRPVDLALADWGWRHGGGPAGALGLALASHAVGLGHTCLPVASPGDALGDAASLAGKLHLPDALADNPLLGRPGDGSARPLILDGGGLYLQRYWDYERRLAERLRSLLEAAPAAVDPTPLGPEGGIFDYDWTAPGETNWQAVAAFVAQRHRLAVVSGGPGTGKTYTVVRLIVRLIDDALAHERQPPVFALAAPTGKAAARMTAAIEAGLGELEPSEKVRNHLPHAATTLHRLLRLRPTTTAPGHDRRRPLPADVVIIDEASMVDLPLMTKLAEAVRDEARLILLGDRYQLASVESGAVLADLCAGAGVNAFSAEQRSAAGALLADAGPAPSPGPLADHVVTLQTSHRFHAESAIGRLAAAINAGEPEALEAALSTASDELRATAATDETAIARLTGELADAYEPLHRAEDPAGALAALERVRLLTGTRVGPLGSDALNRRIAAALGERHGFDAEARWVHARPLMVTVNAPRAGLYNGDAGVLWDEGGGRIRAWFRTETGPRAFHPAVLPAHVSVYAMTIHKAQGSEFEVVYLALPQADSPVLTRELVYTAVTRARTRLRVFATSGAWRRALARSGRRFSGLDARLVP